MSEEYLKDRTIRLIKEITKDIKKHIDNIAHLLEVRTRLKYDKSVEKP